MAALYNAHKVFLNSANFSIIVMEFPQEELSDKLTVLSAEKGLIYKSLYEDFILNTCIANAGSFFYHINRRPELLSQYNEIRLEVLAKVYDINPGLKPDNVVVNNNYVVKHKKDVRSGEEARPLTENFLWDKTPPASPFGPSYIAGAPQVLDDNPFKELDDDESDEEEDEADEEDSTDSNNPFIRNAGSDMDEDDESDVPYELVGHRWEKVGLPVNVRCYDDGRDSALKLLGGTPFKTIRGYHFLIVKLCIEDFSDIIHLLESTGVSKRIPPVTLLEDLYEVAVKYNSFLKYENVDLESLRSEFKERNKNSLKAKKAASATADNRPSAVRRKGPKFNDVTKEKLASLSTDLKKRVIGQDEAIDSVSDAILRASVGLKREHQPLGAFLFMGYSGTGKTETAKALADILCEGSLIRIDCSEYQHAHEVAKLTGSPPGYIGYDDGGHLTREVGKRPFSVVLFDEVEKAHPNFHERLLQVMDDGILTDNKGKTVSFSDTVLIMTSNVGVKDVENISKSVGFGDLALWSHGKQKDAYEGALKRKFKPEFLNRIDEVVTFRRLEEDDYFQILDILLLELNTQVGKKQKISISLTTEAKRFLLDKGIDKKFGARPLHRAIKKHLSTPLAKAIINESVSSNSNVLIDLDKDTDTLIFSRGSSKEVTVND